MLLLPQSLSSFLYPDGGSPSEESPKQYLFLFIYLFIYLVALGLSCGRRAP